MIKNNEIFMNPYTDFGFKKLFGTEPNKDILISFLNSVFQGRRSPIVNLQYLNTEVLGPYYGDRNSVFDVYCTTKDKGHFIVEMQRSEQPYFKDRTVYYASQAVVKQAPKGDWNYKLQEVCVIGILNFTFPKRKYRGDNYFHVVRLKDDDNNDFYKKLTFYYLEMPKFTKNETELVTMLDKWLYVIKNLCYLLEQPKELQDQVFSKFFEEARIGMFSKKEQAAYEQSQKNLWDNYSTLGFSFNKGKKEGRAEGKKEGLAKGMARGKELGRAEGMAEGKKLGRAEGKKEGLAEGEDKAKREAARKMLFKGMSKESILQVTGWTEEVFESV